MAPFELPGSEIDFAITLNKDQNRFEFVGKSRPENVVEYFEPVFNWFETYFKNPLPETIVKFKVDYFNSSTAKVILRLLVKLEEAHNNGAPVKIEWHYRANDEDLLEAGEDYESLVDVPFFFYQYQ